MTGKIWMCSHLVDAEDMDFGKRRKSGRDKRGFLFFCCLELALSVTEG